MSKIDKNEVIAFAPASVANVGPCYDSLGYCLDHLGDFVKATRTLEHKETKLTKVHELFSSGIADIPYGENCVQIVASELWSDIKERYPKFDYGIDLELFKGMPIKSGLGSSAASGVATVKAILNLLGVEGDFEFNQIANPLISTENQVTHGHFYPDNIVPSYFGGFKIISRDYCDEVDVKEFYTVILWQDIKLDTGSQREAINNFIKEEVLSPEISSDFQLEKFLGFIRYQAYCAARIIYGFCTDNTEGIDIAGAAIGQKEVSEYNLLEVVRGTTIDHFPEIKGAAIDAGAAGCAICGSGPSIFAISHNLDKVNQIKDAMISASGSSKARWLISSLNKKGAQVVDNIGDWIHEHKVNHNFWDAINQDEVKDI